MYKATEDDIPRVWEIFKKHKEWFPHVRLFHVRTRVGREQVILEDGVVITYHKNQNNRKIGQNTDVKVEKGSHMIHQILNENVGNGNSEKVIKKFFDFVGSDVYLTVRADNVPANKFYNKIGMKEVGEICWSQGKMLGKVWKYNTE